jgi:Arylsulfotransferase (ASST)
MGAAAAGAGSRDEQERRDQRPRSRGDAVRRASLAPPVLAALAGCALLPASARAGAITAAYPGPGWSFASPATGITLTGVRPDELGGLSVTGSLSGPHPGTLRALAGGRGSVFTPRLPFAAGERVTVASGRPLGHARGRSSYSFRTAVPVAGSWKNPDAPPLLTRERSRPCPLRRPRLHTIAGPRPTGVCLLRGASRRTRGARLLVSPRPPTGNDHAAPGLMILAADGRILWHKPTEGVVHDLAAARYRGQPVLTYYLRAATGPYRHVVLDRHYDVIAQLTPGNGYTANAHELQLTPAGTAYLGSYVPVRLPDGVAVTDFVVQELDIATGDVMFEWHALDHVPLSATYAQRPASGWAWDYFHGNSIEPPRAGGHTLIVSARKTSAVYGIDRRTGRVRWILGGRQDQFGLARRHPRWRFCAQHDARRLPGGDLTLFDNGGTALHGSCPRHAARVLRFRLDTRARRVGLVRSIPSGPSSDDGAGYHPGAVGSARFGPDGDVLVDWGNSGRITDVAPSGRVRFKLQLTHWTYRAVATDWEGAPHGRPAVAARRAGGRVVVWASWNGATRIRDWQLLAGPAAGGLAPVGRRVRHAGLETRLRARTDAARVAVRALDGAGRVIGVSAAVNPR